MEHTWKICVNFSGCFLFYDNSTDFVHKYIYKKNTTILPNKWNQIQIKNEQKRTIINQNEQKRKKNESERTKAKEICVNW